MVEAIDMARDAIGLHGISLEDEQLPIPEASAIEKIDPSTGTFAEDGKGIVSMVDIDFSEYRRKVDNKTVRRNVTLPNWLNREAAPAVSFTYLKNVRKGNAPTRRTKKIPTGHLMPLSGFLCWPISIERP